MSGSEADVTGTYEIGCMTVLAHVKGLVTTYEIVAVGKKGQGATIAEALTELTAEFAKADAMSNDPIGGIRAHPGKWNDVQAGLPTIADSSSSISLASPVNAERSKKSKTELVRAYVDGAERVFYELFYAPVNDLREEDGEALTDVVPAMLALVASEAREWILRKSQGQETAITGRILLCMQVLARLKMQNESVLRKFAELGLEHPIDLFDVNVQDLH